MGGARPRRGRRLRWILIGLVGLVAGLWLLGGGGGLDVQPGSVLVLKLGGSYVEAQDSPLIARLLGDRRRPMASLLHLFALAERDDRIDTVVLRIQSLQIGWGKAQEMRAAIERLRARGRKTIALLELQQFSAHREYYVAAAADEVYVIPGATVPIVGLAAEYLYLGGLFEKLGIDFEVVRAGRYKSAVEFFAAKEMSQASREMANGLIDSLQAQFVEGIASARELEPDTVRATIDAGPMLPRELIAADLIDGEKYLDELLEPLGDVVRGSDYAAIDPSTVGFDPVAQYALIYGSGTVVMGDAAVSRTGSPVFASGRIAKALADAGKDPKISAIILRIDSPGGSALASEVVWRAVKQVRELGKPVVASYSDLAASGGYYASAGADAIVSTAGALTGSIGVFMLRPQFGEALERLDIGVETLTRGRLAELQLASRPLSPAARDRLQAMVSDTYALFVDRVAEGRELTPEEVDAAGQGRVWTGQQALERGLVDELGGLRTAVLAAKRLGGLGPDADVSLIPFPRTQPLAEQIAELLNARLTAAVRPFSPLPDPLHQLFEALALLPRDAPLALAPLLPDVH